MHYLYILHSAGSDLYYVGITANPKRRLLEHNEILENSFTSKYRPRVMVALFKAASPKKAACAERFIKRMKSRVFIEKVIKGEIKDGRIAQLVRVPRAWD